MRTYEQLDAKDAKKFWSKIWERKEHYRIAAQMNNFEK